METASQIDSIQILESLNEAIQILITARLQLASGSQEIWGWVKHAENHLDAQIRTMLRENL